MAENKVCSECDCETPHELATKNEVGGVFVCTKCGAVTWIK